MSKLHLRSLNPQNITQHPKHTNLNTKILNITWKKSENTEHLLNVFNNQIFMFFNNNVLKNTNTYFFYTKINKYIQLQKKNIIKNKKSTNYVKILKNNNKLYAYIMKVNFHNIMTKQIYIKKNYTKNKEKQKKYFYV